jgi:hypothetical protein
MLIGLVLELLILSVMLLLLLLALIPDLLLQDDTVNASLEQSAHRRRLAL